MSMQQATRRETQHTIRINGQRYFLADPNQVGQSGGRTWSNEEEPIEEWSGAPEISIVMLSQGGAGASFEGVEHGYSHANRWAEETPNKLSTWGKFAEGETFTSADYPGWMIFHEGYLFLMRGRYSVKYGPEDLEGSTWSKLDTEDFGASTATFVVGGRPAVHNGVLVVPIVDSADDGNERFQYLATVTSGDDTWATGPANRTFRCFTVWKEKLWAAKGNLIYSQSATPSGTDNWAPADGSGYAVGDTTTYITDMVAYPGVGLVIGKEDGLFTFAEDLNTNDEIPDLRFVKDKTNFVGMQVSQGAVLAPHRSGLIEWTPGAYRYVGPEQDGGLEGSLTPGWGWVRGIANYGKYTFWVANDGDRASVGSFLPGGRGGRLPHIHFGEEDVWYEAATLVSFDSEPPTFTSPASVEDDDAVGTIEWTDPENAEAEDGEEAEATEGTTHYLLAKTPFSLPSDATVLGIVVEVKRRATA